MNTATRTSIATVRQSEEFTLTERVIAEHIASLDADALRFTDTADALHYTPYAYNEGEYVQAAYVPECYDIDDLNQHVAPIVATALNEFCQTRDVADGLIAVNPDNSRELLIKSHLKLQVRLRHKVDMPPSCLLGVLVINELPHATT